MNTIITIGRQFGSGGREIGEKVAEYFGIKCLDKELLTRAAKESGFCEEMIKSHDERPTNSGGSMLLISSIVRFTANCINSSFSQSSGA